MLKPKKLRCNTYDDIKYYFSKIIDIYIKIKYIYISIIKIQYQT